MKYAETWLDVGLYPLRRVDLAAFLYALALLREDHLDAALRVLEAEHAFGGALSAAASWTLEARRDREFQRRRRLLRARLALLLRVLLRVDAEREKYGPRAVGCWWADCRRCNGSGAHSAKWIGIDCPACGGDAVELAPVRIRPLWEAAR